MERSYSRHISELVDLQQQLSHEYRGIAFSYRKLDFDAGGVAVKRRLPFADASVNKICCSLVLSYLKEPLSLIREFHRILRPGGVAVVSSMKPGCDMTVLYHDYVTQNSDTQSELEVDNEQDASVLLSAAGRIKLKEDTGVYQFFEFEELEQFAALSGFEDTQSCRSFGNQANLIRLVK